LRVTSDNPIAESSLGGALADMGLLDQAAHHLVTAIRLAPQYLPPHYMLGTIFHRQNRLDEAQREYQLVADNSSDPAEASQSHNNLGVLFSQRNQTHAALREFDTAIRINPNERNSFLGRGSIEYQQRKADAAIEDFRRAAQIAPSATAYLWLGSACELKSDIVCAGQAYQDALRISPGLREAQNRLTMLQGKAGNSAN
jgi:tetratricopeptide (TPR) repeat protein